MNNKLEIRTKRIENITAAIMRWQDATQKFDEAIGKQFKLNRAERQCLSFLIAGPQTPSAIAKETGLTPSAITSLLDRLEARELVKRMFDEKDRRKTLIVTGTALWPIMQAYAPIVEQGNAYFVNLSEDELRVIESFTQKVADMQYNLAQKQMKDAKQEN